MTRNVVSTVTNQVAEIDATGMTYRELNERLRGVVASGSEKIKLQNVYGQRYIGTDLDMPVELEIFGVPGNDLGAFMDGPRIVVRGNAQDGCGNTMNEGEIIIHGHAGDITGLATRGGRIFIREDVGYRAAIHMKEYGEKKPVLVIGGTAQDFFGEYMAGGIVILLGLNLGDGDKHKARFIGTGMHGGVIYVRGTVEDFQLGKEVGVTELDEGDHAVLREYVGQFSDHFGYAPDEILRHGFIKLLPLWLRPYGRLYAY
jgi:glutamate synthase domain-containing protein 3